MDEFYIIYNSINNLEIPYGNYNIKIKSIIAEFMNGIKKENYFIQKIIF